jgi:deferrochelatase/peroxidase EfeB
MSDKINRRAFLGMAAVGTAGLVLGDIIGLKNNDPLNKSKETFETTGKAASDTSTIEAFYGANQSGILTSAQKFVCMAAFDVTADQAKDVKQLLQHWSVMIAQMMAAKPWDGSQQDEQFPPEDTGEQVGLQPARLTITLGFGAGLFTKDGVDRFGLASRQPQSLTIMPKFHGDLIQDMYTHGDLIVQACGDDPMQCFHAIRNLAKAARGAAHLRWQQAGQWGMKPEGTQRNLFGFKDGTNNPQLNDDAFMKRNIWIEGSANEPAWLKGGTYMVVRRVQMRIETWDQVTYAQQEGIIGRNKPTGAPLDGKKEFDQPDYNKDLDGKVTPLDSHVRLSNPRTGDASERERILRRGFNFMNGLDPVGRVDAGLLFICFNRNIQNQFEMIQRRLTDPKKPDQMLAYTQTTGGGYYVIPPGVTNANSYIGEGLFT